MIGQTITVSPICSSVPSKAAVTSTQIETQRWSGMIQIIEVQSYQLKWQVGYGLQGQSNTPNHDNRSRNSYGYPWHGKVDLTERCGVYLCVVQTAGVQLIVPDIRSPKDKCQPRILFHQGYVVITGNMYWPSIEMKMREREACYHAKYHHIERFMHGWIPVSEMYAVALPNLTIGQTNN